MFYQTNDPEKRVEIFEDTLKLCKTHKRLRAATTASIHAQEMIPEHKQMGAQEIPEHDRPANVLVTKNRSFQAAEAYAGAGKKTCVLNFASASNPGGGVTRGAGAQEECLCRVSTLYLCLNDPGMWDAFYQPHRMARNPLHNDDIIYTPDVVVFKTDTPFPKLRKEQEWFMVDILTCAAPNLRENSSNRYNPHDGDHAVRISNSELQELHEHRLERILDVAEAKGAQVLILGAFGCGAFRNPPETVARAAKAVLPGYIRKFDTIEFAVYCPPKNMENYEAFRRILQVTV